MNTNVTSFELSEKLRDAGIPQNSEYSYWKVMGQIKLYDSTQASDYTTLSDKKICSAFLASELGEQMKGKGMGVCAFASIGQIWWCSGGIWDAGKQAFDGLEQAGTMPEALGQMYLYLKNKGLL